MRHRPAEPPVSLEATASLRVLVEGSLFGVGRKDECWTQEMEKCWTQEMEKDSCLTAVLLSSSMVLFDGHGWSMKEHPEEHVLWCRSIETMTEGLKNQGPECRGCGLGEMLIEVTLPDVA